MNELLHRNLTRRAFIFTCLGVTSLALTSSHVQTSSESDSDQIPPPRNLRYEIDRERIEEMATQNHVNILIHAYGAIEHNGRWIIHPLSEQTLQAAVLLFQYIQKKNPHCHINVLMGGEVPYGNQSIGEREGQRLRQLIREAQLTSDNIFVLDTQQIDSKGEPLSRGFSTSGELDYAIHVFDNQLFYSFAPSPHTQRIDILIRNKNLQARALSFDGVVYKLGNYEKIDSLIRKYWLRFSLYEIFICSIVLTIDPKGKLLEARARKKRQESPPPTF